VKYSELVPRGLLVYGSSCLLCPQRAPVVVTDHMVPGDGTVVICPRCILKLGRTIGLVSRARADVLVERVDELERDNTRLQGELRSAKEQLAGLAQHLGRYAGDVSTLTPVDDVEDETRICQDCKAVVAKASFGAHRRHCQARARA
jgi:hypothetical protein